MRNDMNGSHAAAALAFLFQNMTNSASKHGWLLISAWRSVVRSFVRSLSHPAHGQLSMVK
jgi:hypothetical protein